VAELQALNNTLAPGYVTTLALTYVPCPLVQVLQQQILNWSSPLYGNTDSSVAALVSNINPDIGIARRTPLRTFDYRGAAVICGICARSKSSSAM